jgi:predicted permease
MTAMSEGALLSLAAGICSLLFAAWGIAAARHAVTSLLPGTFRATSIALDGRVLVSAILAIVVTGVLASVIPAWYVSHTPVAGVLKDAGPTHTGGRSWRNALLVGEIASVSVLLVVSWMFVASFIRVVGLDLGVDSSRLLAVASNLSFKGSAYDMADRLRSVAGVEDVAVVGSSSLPLVGWAYGGAWDTVTLQRDDPDTGAAARVMKYRVTPNFFRVAGARFLRGSTWRAETALGTSPIVLDERAAATLFGSVDPLGQRVKVVDPTGVFTVVGIVPHVYTSGPEGTGDPEAYFDLPQSTGYRSLFVRTSRPAGEMVPVVTNALAPFAPDTDAPFVRRVDDAIGRLTAVRRFNTAVMLLFGVVGMIIGAVGVYGVMAATVTQQSREIGIRVALGATPGAIRRGVLRLTARHLVMGLGVGLPLGGYLSRGFAGYLFQVTPADASVYAGVAALLAMVAVSAALIPARRAARLDPIRTLRAT